MEEQDGEANSYRGSTSWMARSAGGGAGNTGGKGKYTYSNSGTDWESGNGQNGTGGLLMLYTNSLYNSGEISAKRHGRWSCTSCRRFIRRRLYKYICK